MPSTRRSFLRLGAAAGATIPLASVAGATRAQAAPRPLEPAPRPKRLLILGGTGFIGPHQVRYAVARGHDVTIFTRGRRTPELPEGITWLKGDRNDDLKALEGKEWDVVVDNPTTLPVWVRDAASLLADAAEQYVFVSTISVYASNDAPDADEDASLAEYPGEDPLAETMDTFRERVNELYGPLKAAAEREAETWFPGRTTVVRPGLIVGPGDPTDRFTYWPVRVARGGEILAPPAEHAVQIVDVRDLAEFTVHVAESGTTGVFNVTGPATTLTVGGLLWGCWAVTGGDARFAHVTSEFLAEQGVAPWVDLPVWVPEEGETAGFSRRSVARALAAGLRFRPLATTVADTLAWHGTRPAEERGPALRAGLAPDREAAVLARR